MRRVRPVLAAVAGLALLASVATAGPLTYGPQGSALPACAQALAADAAPATQHDGHDMPGRAPTDAGTTADHDCRHPCLPVGCTAASVCLTTLLVAPADECGLRRGGDEAKRGTERSAPLSRGVAPDIPPPRG